MTKFINTLTFADGISSVDVKPQAWTESRLLNWAKGAERNATSTGLQEGGVAWRVLNGDMPAITVEEESNDDIAQVKRYVMLLEMEAQGTAFSKSSRVKNKYLAALANLAS